MKRSIPFNYQDLTIDEHRSSTLYNPAACPLNPNQIDYRILQHHYSPPRLPQHQQCHEYEHVNQLCQQPHQLLQAPPQQVLEHTHLAGYNGNRYCESLPIPHYMGVPNYHDQPQQGSTARVSFWKAFNDTVLSDAKGKQEEVKENERCLVYDSAVENSLQYSQTVATAGLSLGECHVSNVSAPTTIGVDQVFSEEKQALKKSAKKKKRKMKVKEDLGLMNAFFKKLVKGVINQQEVLQNKFLEVIERLDREQAEREEAWRRQEIEIYDKEAVAKARERDLASRRESSIVSSIEKITGTRFSFVSGRTHEN